MQEPMTCQEIREAVDGLTANHPSLTEERQVHEHLAGCASCRVYYEEARSQNELLAAWVAPAPRGNMQGRVMAAIAGLEREARERDRQPGLWRRAAAWLVDRRFRMPAAAALGGAALLLFSLGLNAVLLTTQRTGGGQQAIYIQTPPPNTPGTTNVTLPMTPLAGKGTDAVNTFVRGGLAGLGAYSQTGATPLGVIIILGSPPVEDTAQKEMTRL